MKLDKNGYQSEKSDSFATAVKMLTFIFGLGVIVAAVCVYAMFSGCGSGGSGSGEPVYDENGNCTENCSSVECPACGYFEYIDGKKICMLNNCVNNGDGWVAAADSYYPAGDSCNGDTCVAKPQYDSITGACEAIKAGKKPPEVCMPWQPKHTRCLREKELQGGMQLPCESQNKSDCACAVVVSDDGWFNPKCVPDEYCDPHDWYTCATDSDCQKVPCEDWPPEVCWGLPCMLVGKWQCSSEPGYDEVWEYTDTDIEFYDNGDGYCTIILLNELEHDSVTGEYFPKKFYYKPGNDHIQRPPSGPSKEKYTFLDGGSQLQWDGSGTFTCTKLVEE